METHDASKNSDEQTDEPRILLEEEENFGGPKFFPPLFKQRYASVARVLATQDVKKVVDFGCSECGFMRFLREVPCLEAAIGVDIDRRTLLDHRRAIQPQAYDFLAARERALKMALYVGSLTEYDHRMKGVDAVTMIEVIEHLFDDALKAFPRVIFGLLHPRLVILTTPNEEFNVLFPGFKGFRHPDHKFEWTRNEFQNWCNDVAEQYGYAVTYSGIGEPPEDSQHLGCCSQMAVFTCKGEFKPDDTADDEPYELIVSEVFPASKKSAFSIEDDIRIQADYYLRQTALHLRHEYWNTPSADIDSASDTADDGDNGANCFDCDGEIPDTMPEICENSQVDGACERLTVTGNCCNCDSSTSQPETCCVRDMCRSERPCTTSCRDCVSSQESSTSRIVSSSHCRSCDAEKTNGVNEHEVYQNHILCQSAVENQPECVSHANQNRLSSSTSQCVDSLNIYASDTLVTDCSHALPNNDSSTLEKNVASLSLGDDSAVENDGLPSVSEKSSVGNSLSSVSGGGDTKTSLIQGYFRDDDPDVYQISMHLEHLRGFSRLKQICEDSAKLRSVLLAAGYTITDDDHVLYDLEPHYSSMSSDMVASSELNEEDSDEHDNHECRRSASDWSDGADDDCEDGNAECWDSENDDETREESAAGNKITVTEGGYTYIRQLPKRTCCHGSRECPTTDCNHGDHFCHRDIRCDHDGWCPRKPLSRSFTFGFRKPPCTCRSSVTAAPTMANSAIRTLCPACTPAYMLGRRLHEPHQFSDAED